MNYLQGGPRLDFTNLPVTPLNIEDFFFCYWSHMQCLPWLLCKREMAFYCTNEAGIPWHDLHPSGFVSSGKLAGFQYCQILSQCS